MKDMSNFDHGDKSGIELAMVLLVCALGFALVLRAQPIWTIGFYQDDALVSAWRREGALRGLSVYEYCFALAKAMFVSQGRVAMAGVLLILPLQVAIEDNLILYRIVQGASQLVALGAFAIFVGALSRSAWFALACATAFVGIFEIRNYHDAAFSYFLLYPLIITAGSLSCYYAVKHSERQAQASWAGYWPILAFNAVGILTYEMSLPFCLLSCAILLLNGPHPFRDRLLRAVIAGAPVVIVVAAGIVAKSMASSTYEGTMLGSLDPRVLAATYAKQLLAAAPLSYWTLDPHQIFERLLRDPRLFPQTAVAGVAMFVAVTCAFALGIWKSRMRHSWLLLLTAVVLVFVPPGLVSLSVKYQKETVAGVGYLQTVVSYLGVGMIVAWLAVFASERLRARHRSGAIAVVAIVSMAAGVVSAVTLVSSYRVAEVINESWRYPREVSEVWMRASPVPEGGKEVIVVDRDWLHRWETPPYLSLQRGTVGRIITRTQYQSEKGSIDAGTHVTFLRHPDIVHPTDIALYLESSPLARDGLLIRGFAVSASKVKLRHAVISLGRGEARWPMDEAVHRGRHGYYYRAMELRVESARPDEFALHSR